MTDHDGVVAESVPDWIEFVRCERCDGPYESPSVVLLGNPALQAAFSMSHAEFGALMMFALLRTTGSALPWDLCIQIVTDHNVKPGEDAESSLRAALRPACQESQP